MWGSASDSTRAMSWGETVISGSSEECGGAAGTSGPIPNFVARLLASRRPMRKRAPRLIRPALLEQPGDGGAKLGDAGTRARRRRQRLGVRGGVLGQRRLGRGEEGGQLGRLDAVGLGQHNLVVDRGLVQERKHLVVRRLEPVAGIDEQVDARETGPPPEEGV